MSAMDSTCSTTSSSETSYLERRLSVDRLEAAGGDEPRARIRGHALARPLLHRRDEGLVQRLLRDVEITQLADQGGEDSAGLGAVEVVD